MNLSLLSAETLQCLCSYLDAFDLLKTLLIGCPLLTAKLFASGTVKHLDCVAYSSASNAKPLLPSYLPLLGSLESLSITTYHNEVLDHTFRGESAINAGENSTEAYKGPIKRNPTASDFASLPRSLTSLSSHVFLDYVRFMEAYTSDTTLFPNLRTLDLGGAISFRRIENGQVWPPALTSLTLEWDLKVMLTYYDNQVLKLELKQLPRTLERLECFGISLVPSDFPSSLLALRLSQCMSPSDILPLLPERLTELSIQSHTCGATCSWAFPLYLEYLRLSSYAIISHHAFCDALRRSTSLKTFILTDLDLGSPSFFASLPPNLEYFGQQYSKGGVCEYVQVELPKSLTTVETNRTFASWDQLSIFPASCVSLNLELQQSSGDKVIPNYLDQCNSIFQRFKRLHTMELFSEPDDEVIAALPSGLSTLVCRGFYLNGRNNLKLPTPHLKTLKMTKSARNWAKLDIDASFIQWLPISLTSLSIEFLHGISSRLAIVTEKEDVVPFPSTLTQLSLVGFSGSDSSWLSLLPRSLKDLQLEWHQVEYQQFWEPLDESFPNSPVLPSSITNISLKMNMRSRLVLLGIMGSVQRLTNLKDMELATVEEPDDDANLFEAQDLLLLPRSTRELRLSLGNNIHSIESTRFLPYRCRLNLLKGTLHVEDI